jgi:hypothetical protein
VGDDDEVDDIEQRKRDRRDAAVQSEIDAIPGSWERERDQQDAADDEPAAA